MPDLIAPGLEVLFCGINPSLYSAATGHHFARPGNRFWPALYGAGFTERLLQPWEEKLLLEDGAGITNLVARATATAAELTGDELREGRRRLARKVRRYRPRCVAVVGIGAYRVAFDEPRAGIGRQPALLDTGDRLGVAQPQRTQRQPSAARSDKGVPRASAVRRPVSSPGPMTASPSTAAAR